MSKTTNSLRIFQYLDGTMGLPDTVYIGKDCRNHHGKDGKTIRARNNDHCIRCSYMVTKRRQAKKYPAGQSPEIRRKIEDLLDEKALRNELEFIS